MLLRRLDMFSPSKPLKTYQSKPWKQRTYPGQRVQRHVRVVSRRCIAGRELRLFRYTAMDGVYPLALSGCLFGAVY